MNLLAHARRSREILELAADSESHDTAWQHVGASFADWTHRPQSSLDAA